MAESTKNHTGLLREEMLALRYIFGLGPIAGISFQNDSILDTLKDTCVKDVVFLGLATKIRLVKRQGVHLIKQQLSPSEAPSPVKQLQIAISVFDTRSLTSRACWREQMEHGFMTRHFCVLNNESWGPGSELEQQTGDVLSRNDISIGQAEYCKYASKGFLFGATEVLMLHQLKPVLEQIVADDRKVVLAVHNAYLATAFLREMGIDLRSVYTIETQKAAQTALGLARRYSLEQLLEELSLPYKHSNHAGNDANFTLRALLMMVVRDSYGIPLCNLQHALLVNIQTLSRSIWHNSACWIDREENCMQPLIPESKEKKERKRQRIA